ncbi:DinB family protein [Fimbriimonas ginsengisoli]|uniref:DinB family protein n=1 Tax=Fimbriimonas ginsengisoli Gsoil 348 TaxID=661478 RepID=A0A068NYG1_FIMGI|nr:DinB family protein [Fimbriimonas ginsengisoli]AIE86944.1 DinB family protein [Fimbriimonas ginsengisoli Gsoil 348]
MRDSLIEGFQYDLWANRQWVDMLKRVEPNIIAPAALVRVAIAGPWPDFPTNHPLSRAGEVFAHLLWAQRIWLERVGTSVAPEKADGYKWVEALHQGWVDELQSRDPEERIAYRNSSGRPFERSLAEIARHVVNHGTYHRGQLREIIGAVRPTGLPNTDLIGFFAER